LTTPTISAKATKTLNFVRRDIYRCPSDVKALAYSSLIRPHLEFASAAFDPCTVSNTNCLDKVQHRAARFVKSDYRYTTSVSHLVSDLGWQSLTQRRKNARFHLFYKGIHGLAAVPVDTFHRPIRTSRYSDGDTFTTLSSRVDSYKYSFFPQTISDWNKLPLSVRSKPTVDLFRAALLQLLGPVEKHC